MFGKWIACFTHPRDVHEAQHTIYSSEYHDSSDTALNEITIPIHHLMIYPQTAHVFSLASVRPRHFFVVLRSLLTERSY
jgi:hypothetical protein